MMENQVLVSERTGSHKVILKPNIVEFIDFLSLPQ